MKIAVAVLLLMLTPFQALAQFHDQPFFVAGVDAAVEARMPYAVFTVSVPDAHDGPVCIRVFDADLAGAHDYWRTGASVTYSVFGNGCGSAQTGSETELPECDRPLAEVRLQDQREYDNRWRTLAVLEPHQGAPEAGRRVFRLLVNAALSSANKFQVFVSSEEKRNTPIPGAEIQAPFVNLALPGDRAQMTQVRFWIPESADSVGIASFDADADDYGTRLFFETPYRNRVPIPGSRNEKTRVTDVMLQPEEKGGIGAVVLTSERANFLQIHVRGDGDERLPLILPVLSAPVNRLPVARFSWTPLAQCTSLVLDGAGSTDPDGDELSFLWEFEDGARMPGSRVVRDFKTPGPHRVMLAVSDDSGFVADTTRKSLEVVINAPPAAKITAPDRGVPETPIRFDATGSTDADGRIVGYEWDFGDGARARGAMASHAYRQPGRYRVLLTIEDDGEGFCRTDRARHELWINAPPVAHLLAPERVAAGEPTTLDATASLDSDGAIVGFDWDMGDGTALQGETVSHQWRAPGAYRVSLKVTDDSETGNGSAETTTIVVVNAPPVPRPVVKPVAATGEKLRLNASKSEDPDGKITAYEWETGDGRRLTGESVALSYDAPGVYQGKLTVTDDSGTRSDSASAPFSIRINTPPVADAGEDRVVNASRVRFDGAGSSDADDPIIRYEWDFGDGGTADGRIAEHIYRVPGVYTATLTVTDGSGTASARTSDAVLVTVNAPPVADAGVDRVTVPGESITLDGSLSHDPDGPDGLSGQIAFFTWQLGDRLTEGETFTHTFFDPGVYQIRLTVTDAHGASDTDFVQVTVNAPPLPMMTPITRVAPGESVVFDGSASVDPDGVVTAYEWQFGDGSPPVAKAKATHRFNAPGRYPVTLSVKDDSPAANGEAVLNRIVAVNYAPVAEAGPDMNTCDQRILFDGGGSGDPDGDALDWEWRFGDGSTGFGPRIFHFYKTAGRYPVTLTVNDGTGLPNAVHTDTLTALVNAPPKAVIKSPRNSVCAGESLLLDGSDSADPEGRALKFVWDLGDGISQTGAHATRIYETGGDYIVRLAVFDDSGLPCDTDTAEMRVHVIDAPVARAGEDRTVCRGEAVAFDASASIFGGRPLQSLEWDFGDGNHGAGVDAVHVYHDPGEYTARLRLTVVGDGECENVSEDALVVRVLAGPVAEIRSPDAGCAGEPLVFESAGVADGDGIVRTWTFDDGAETTGTRVEHAFESPGEHSVRLTVTSHREGRCPAQTAVKTIRINRPPSAKIRSESPPAVIRPHTLLRFSADQSTDPDGAIRSYEWDFGDGSTTQGLTAAHAYASSGAHTLSLAVTDASDTACGRVVASQTVHVSAEPDYRLVGPDAGCVDAPVEFSLSGYEGSPETVAWFFGDGTTAEGLSVEKRFSRPGHYAVQAETADGVAPVRTIRIMQPPELTLPSGVQAMAGDRVEIRAVSPTPLEELTLEWDAGDGKTMTGERFSRVWREPGNHTVALSVSGTDAPPCLFHRYDIPVIIHDPPHAEIETKPADLFAGGARDEITFTAVIAESALPWSCHWEFGDGTTADGPVAIRTFAKGGKYTVKLTLKDALRLSAQSFAFDKTITVENR